MDEQILNHITTIVDGARYLLSEEGGTLTADQTPAVQMILRNAERFIHIYAEFEQATADEIAKFMRHDLGNILTPIRGFSDLLVRQRIGDLNPDQHACVEGIQQSTVALYEAIQKLVALATGTRD